MLLIHSTYPSEKKAMKDGEELVKRKLAACAGIYPIFSIYSWKGKLKKEKEWVLELKASKKNYRKIESLILKTHPYKLPAIYATNPQSAYSKFKSWVRKG